MAFVPSLASSALARGTHITILSVELYPRASHPPQVRWRFGRESISWHRLHFPGLGDVRRHSAGRPGWPRSVSLLAFQQTVTGKISKGVSKCNSPSGSLTGVGGPGPGGSAQTREHVQGRGATAEPFGWVFPGEATAVLCRVCLARPPAHRQNGHGAPGDIGSCHLPGELFRRVIIALLNFSFTYSYKPSTRWKPCSLNLNNSDRTEGTFRKADRH